MFHFSSRAVRSPCRPDAQHGGTGDGDDDSALGEEDGTQNADPKTEAEYFKTTVAELAETIDKYEEERAGKKAAAERVYVRAPCAAARAAILASRVPRAHVRPVV